MIAMLTLHRIQAEAGHLLVLHPELAAQPPTPPETQALLSQLVGLTQIAALHANTDILLRVAALAALLAEQTEG